MRRFGQHMAAGVADFRLADEVEAETVISYREIDGFPCSTALAHKGRLVCGKLGGIVASEAISHYGPRAEADLKELTAGV